MPKYKMIGIGMCTLAGSPMGGFPVKYGNCFEAVVEGSEHDWKIVNFYYENIKYLLDNGLTYPITIQPITARIAVIDDHRIYEEFYNTKYCEVCCPERLWPEPQRMARERLIRSGKLIVTDIGDGLQLEKMSVESKSHPLKAKFTIEAENLIHSDYIPIEINKDKEA